MVQYHRDVPATQHARRPIAELGGGRRAFSIIELLVVIGLLGLLATMAVLRFGDDAVHQAAAEGYVRRLALDLRAARSMAISTGDDCGVVFGAGPAPAQYVVQRFGAGDVDAPVATPAGVSVTTTSTAWWFGFDGALLPATTGSSIRVDGPTFYWVITLYSATGSLETARFPQS